MMKIALIYPPSCDPTAPYLSVPTLTGCLRAHGVEVRPIDANVEAHSRLLSRETLTDLAGRVEERWAKLKRKSSLNHAEQLAGAALWEARGDARSAPDPLHRSAARERRPVHLRRVCPGRRRGRGAASRGVRHQGNVACGRR